MSRSLPICTREEEAACLKVLREADTPLVAVDLAARLDLTGSRETQRRQVRAIIEQLRDGGSMIVATNAQGYWLTDDPNLYRDYLECRQIDAKSILGDTGMKKSMLCNAKGQGLLFQNKINVGCATMVVE